MLCMVVNLETAVGEGRNEIADRGVTAIECLCGVVRFLCKSSANVPKVTSWSPDDGIRGTGGTGKEVSGEMESGPIDLL